MASFPVKISGGRPRKRENKKKIVHMSSYKTRNRKLKKKIAKKLTKFKKEKKTLLRHLFKPK